MFGFQVYAQNVSKTRAAERTPQEELASFEKGVELWAKQAKIDPLVIPRLKENLLWLTIATDDIRSAGEKKKVQALLGYLFVGTGNGRVGLMTLNEAITDMRQNGVGELTEQSLRSYLLYLGGREGGAERWACETKKGGGSSRFQPPSRSPRRSTQGSRRKLPWKTKLHNPASLRLRAS